MISIHIALQVFILNGIWSILAVGEIPTKYWNLPANSFLRPLQWRHTNENRNYTDVLQMHQNANMNFVHSELVQVFYDIKWISSGAFEFEKKKKNP